VITQPRAGSFAAFTAVCTHQGCTVSTVSDSTINCPCHGSKFSITNGSVVGGPAPSPLAAVSIKVHGTSIVRA
jgi:Rieske Fe-S protein